MTKANLITDINTQLTAIITQAKVRLASMLLVDELYAPTTTETYSLSEEITTITAKTTTSLYYTIDFKKVGSQVFVNGFVRNSTGGTFSGTIFNIVDSEYNVKTDRVVPIITDLSGTFTLSGSLLIGTLGDGEKHSFNFSYTTND
jgi:hypothetical protein